MTLGQDERNKRLLRDRHNLQIATTLHTDTSFEGDLTLHTSLRVQGAFKGSIACNGYVQIDNTAVVNADINADVVIIDGKVTGNIYGTYKVELAASAEVHGDITTHKLKIADGVVFTGKCKMLRNDGTTAPVVSTL